MLLDRHNRCVPLYALAIVVLSILFADGEKISNARLCADRTCESKLPVYQVLVENLTFG